MTEFEEKWRGWVWKSLPGRSALKTWASGVSTQSTRVLATAFTSLSKDGNARSNRLADRFSKGSKMLLPKKGSNTLFPNARGIKAMVELRSRLQEDQNSTIRCRSRKGTCKQESQKLEVCASLITVQWSLEEIVWTLIWLMETPSPGVVFIGPIMCFLRSHTTSAWNLSKFLETSLVHPRTLSITRGCAGESDIECSRLPQCPMNEVVYSPGESSTISSSIFTVADFSRNMHGSCSITSEFGWSR